MVRLQDLVRVLSSPRFFVAVLILFFIESAWIAVSAAYPMVFDENVHFGVIQLYAHQWSPFFPAHSTYVEPFGALVSDPSFLYRYLMSFPYRLISAVTTDQTIQIIFLRFINIFLFGSSLVLFRKLLLKTRVSAAITHSAILFFVLIPIVPLLAGQINYDNMVLVIAALAMLEAVLISDRLERNEVPAAHVLWLLAILLVGSLVQFEFLAFSAAIMLWLVWRLVGAMRSQEIDLLAGLKKAWLNASWRSKLTVGIPLIVVLALFTYAYGGNLVRYHNLLPQCNQVLTSQQCAGSSAWVRAQADLAHKQPINTNPLLFAAGWTYRMLIAMFYTSSGGASPQAYYLSINPLPVVFVTALVLLGTGALLLIKYRRTVFEGYEHFGFLLFVSLFYATVLCLYNYRDYLHLGEKIAINGRYLLPVALPCMVAIALAFRRLLERWHYMKSGLLMVFLLLFLQGGGALTYITVSSSSWYWQNRAAARLNSGAQAVVRPLILLKNPIPPIKP